MPIDLDALAPGMDQNWSPPAGAPREFITGNKPPVEWSEDLRRVIALPRRKPPVEGTPEAEALVRLMTAQFARHNPRCECQSRFKQDCIRELLPAQAWGLYELATTQGLVAAIQVGGGKTILGLLASLAMPNCRLAVLLCPPGLVEQLIDDFHQAGQHFWMPHIVSHHTKFNFVTDSRCSLVRPGSPVLHIFPYSLLSQAAHTDWLERTKPDAMFADEVHMLSDTTSARTKRFLRFFEVSSTTRFGCWSGSLSGKALEDYAHHCLVALREGSPLPIAPVTVREWDRAISAESWVSAHTAGALMNLCVDGEDVRAGFQRRLHDTKGFVHTTKSSSTAELRIQERKVQVPREVVEIMNTVRSSWLRPDWLAPGGSGVMGEGEELQDQFALNRCLNELSCGFFYRWKFPRGEKRELIEQWLEVRKQWNKEVREQLLANNGRGLAFMDSPKLCTQAAARFYGDNKVTIIDEYGKAKEHVVEEDQKLPRWESVWYPAWRDIRDQVKPATEAIRLHPFLAEDAARWGHEHRGIIWINKREFGQWVAELSGLPLHLGGDDAGRLIGAEDGSRSIIASIGSHGTGRNGLQFKFWDNLIANVMASAVKVEQLIGRTDRRHQKSPFVSVDAYLHTPELARFLSKALMRAQYIKGTLGADQKLLNGASAELLEKLGDGDDDFDTEE